VLFKREKANLGQAKERREITYATLGGDFVGRLGSGKGEKANWSLAFRGLGGGEDMIRII